MGNAPLRAVIYCRISEDRDGTKESPVVQRKTCLDFAAKREWVIVGEFEDRDLTAADPKVRRPGYDEAVRMLVNNEADVLVARSLDRIQRSSLQWNLLVGEMIEHSKRIVTADGSYDLASPDAMFMGQLLAAVAEKEVANTKRRAQAATKAKAEEGRPHPGGKRPYGYIMPKGTRTYVQVPEEVEEIRAMVGKVLAGESLHSILNDLNERGVLTTDKNPWQSSTLSRMLRSETLCGYRMHKGERHKGNWYKQAILTETEHAQIVGVITANQRGRETKAKYLLTGILQCGGFKADGEVCGHKLTGEISGAKKTLPKYRCKKFPGYDCCGSNSIVAEKTEERFVGLLFAHLRATEATETDPREELDALHTELRKQERLKETLQTDWYNGDSDLEEQTYRTLLGRRGQAIADLTLRIGRLESATVVVDVPADIVAWWGAASLAEKRTLIRAHVESAVVTKATHRGGTYDKERLKLAFR